MNEIIFQKEFSIFFVMIDLTPLFAFLISNWSVRKKNIFLKKVSKSWVFRWKPAQIVKMWEINKNLWKGEKEVKKIVFFDKLHSLSSNIFEKNNHLLFVQIVAVSVDYGNFEILNESKFETNSVFKVKILSKLSSRSYCFRI